MGNEVICFGSTNDGYLVNPNSPRVNGLASTNDPDIGKSEESGLRISVAGPVNDSLSAYASFRWNDYEGPNNHWVRELNKNSLQHPNIVDTTTNPQHERDTTSAMLELTWEHDGMDVTSVTSHTDTESTRYSDLDISPEYLLDLIRPEDMQVFTQELRFTSTDDGPIQWLGGLYYSMYEEKMRSELIWWNTEAVGDNFTGPLGCAAGMDTCSGVWAGETLTLAQEQMSLRTPFEMRDRDKSHLAAFANMTSTYDDWELGLGLRIDKWENESTNLDSGFSSDINRYFQAMENLRSDPNNEIYKDKEKTQLHNQCLTLIALSETKNKVASYHDLKQLDNTKFSSKYTKTMQTLTHLIEQSSKDYDEHSNHLYVKKINSLILLTSQILFLRHAVHETNTPISVIMSNIELYEMEHGKNKYLSTSEVALKNIFNIYDDLSYLVKKDQVNYPKRDIDFIDYKDESLAQLKLSQHNIDLLINYKQQKFCVNETSPKSYLVEKIFFID